MRHHLVALTYWAIALAVCHAQFVYPDQFESMKAEEERRQLDGQPRAPLYTTGSHYNEVEPPPHGGGYYDVPYERPRPVIPLEQGYTGRQPPPMEEPGHPYPPPPYQNGELPPPPQYPPPVGLPPHYYDPPGPMRPAYPRPMTGSGWRNTGNTGWTGNTGNTGWTGTTGSRGWTGSTGNRGWTTNTGNTGWSTNTGNTGWTTNTGNTGWTTNTGNTGGTTRWWPTSQWPRPPTTGWTHETTRPTTTTTRRTTLSTQATTQHTTTVRGTRTPPRLPPATSGRTRPTETPPRMITTPSDKGGLTKWSAGKDKTSQPRYDAQYERRMIRPQYDKYGRPSSEQNVPPLGTILPTKWRDHVVNIISTGVTKFTLDMDNVLDTGSLGNRENLLFSPISLTVTLAMVLLASSGRTFEEVAKILGLESGVDISNHSEMVHQMFGFLIQQFDMEYLLDNNAPQCKVAFGIFVEDGYPIRPQFKSVSEKVYKSDVVNVDFSNQSRIAQIMINNWAEEKTMGKIKDLLSEPPSPLTELIIASALYFSGEWNQHFSEGSTTRRPFKIEADETVYVDLMYNGGSFPYYEDKELGLKIIAFPYKGLKISMYALLPSEEGAAALKEMKSRLTPEIIDELISKMKNSSCIIGYPRMELSSTLKLQSAMEALGLRSLFDSSAADLSILSPGRGHKDNHPDPSFISSRTYDPYNYPYGHPLDDRSNPQSRNHDNYGYKYRTQNYTVEQWKNGYNLRFLPRSKRDVRPIDNEFIDFLNSQRFPTFGVDELRNSAGTSNPGLFADDVLHKVVMTVNEKGTEAAAVTSILLDRTGDYKRFIANRPFLFFIRHDVAKLIWFWGSINRPTPYYGSP